MATAAREETEKSLRALLLKGGAAFVLLKRSAAK